MQRSLVDSQRKVRTMDNTGGEDTALLRSNRSAHAGAGTRAGVCRSGSLLPSPMSAMRSGHKATNLGVWGHGASRPEQVIENLGALDVVVYNYSADIRITSLGKIGSMEAVVPGKPAAQESPDQYTGEALSYKRRCSRKIGVQSR